MPEYDHSQVAEKVAEAFEEYTSRNVRTYSESSDSSHQYVVVNGNPTSDEFQAVLEETGCAVTHFEERSDSSYVDDDEQGTWIWFGYVDVGIDGPSFVDRQRPL